MYHSSFGCRNPGLAIPLIALQYHEVKINLEFNTLDQCLWAVRANLFGVPANNAGCTSGTNTVGINAVDANGDRLNPFGAFGRVGDGVAAAGNANNLAGAALNQNPVGFGGLNQGTKVGNLGLGVPGAGAAQAAGVNNNFVLGAVDQAANAAVAAGAAPNAPGVGGFNFDNRGAASLQSVQPGREDRAYNSCCLVSASLYIDYVFLDTDERRRMAQNPHEYLIEQLQFTGDESIGSTSNKIKLNFNHPCKELVWVVQPDAHVDYCSSFTEQIGERSCDWDNVNNANNAGGGAAPCCGNAGLYNALGAQPFNYSDALDMIPRSWLGYGNIGLTSTQFIHTKGQQCCNRISRLAQPWAETTLTAAGGAANGLNPRLFANIPRGLGDQDLAGGAALGQGKVPSADVDFVSFDPRIFALGGAGGFRDMGEMSGSNVSTAGTIVLGETSRKLHCWGQNPVVTAKLLLNGQDRFSERLGSYFDVVQPYQHHTASPDTGINCYSFALRPEEHQPSGTCNFSRIDNACLQLVVSSNAVGGASTAKVRVYATNYNVLRVMSGMGGLAYSN
jgi:hypothetical protein